jgi:thioesterase domain-containing protein
LFSKITKEFDVDLTLASLITHSTFKDILMLIKKEKGETQLDRTASPTLNNHIVIPSLCSSLVAIKPTGSKRPIYVFHGVGGNVLNYMRLGPACSDHPLIGVQAQGIDGRSLPQKSIADMVTKYVDDIRLVQPKGPYILSGASMGGIIAIEVANKLKDIGEEVEAVILLDTFGPDINIKNYSSKNNWFEAKWTVLKWKIKRLWVRFKSALHTMMRQQIPHDIRYFNIEVLNYQALWAHKVTSYKGDIHIIRAPLQVDGWYSDPDMGWKKTVQGDIYTYIVDGSHEDFVESKDLPKVFSDVINRF